MIPDIRLRLVFLAICLCFSAVILRLFYWQINSSERLTAMANAQHYAAFEIPAQRGEIKSFDGANLVSNIQTNLLFANLKEINKSSAAISASVAPLIVSIIPLVASDSGREKNTQEITRNLNQLLNTPNVVWVALRHQIDDATRQKIADLKISGLEFAPETTRFYPEASMAAHLLGFVGSDQNGLPKGYFGLEGYYHRELAGKSGERRLEKDAFGQTIALGAETVVPSENGRTLIISLDRYIQKISEKHLSEGLKNWGASSGTVIVANPKTGAILAMATFPAFTPANFSYYSADLYKNPAISESYEPGSIFKPLIMAAALNENKIKPETVCDQCAGPRYLEGGIIRTFNDQYHPNITMTEVLENSDNTGMVFIGGKLGKDLLLGYLRKYQFDKKTGIDLEGEEERPLKKDWYPLDLATLTFGQGIAVTPIQMIRAFSALANGGYLVTPQVVMEIVDKDKKITLKANPPIQILKTETAKTITKMLVSVTEKSPLHFPRDRTANLNKFAVAAKSGTAQIPVAGHYQEGKTVGSVIGFAPVDNPKFLVLVKLNEPSVRQWGSDTAGPIFFNIIRDLLLYYNISPSQ